MPERIPLCSGLPGRIPQCGSPGRMPACLVGHPCFGSDGLGMQSLPDAYVVTVAGASSCGCVVNGNQGLQLTGDVNGTFMLQRLPNSCMWSVQVSRQFVYYSNYNPHTGQCEGATNVSQLTITLFPITNPPAGPRMYRLRFEINAADIFSFVQPFRGYTTLFTQYDPEWGDGPCMYGPFGVQLFQAPDGILVTPL